MALSSSVTTGFTLWSPLAGLIRAPGEPVAGLKMLNKLRSLGQARHQIRHRAMLGALLGVAALSTPALAQGYPVPPAPIPQSPNQPAQYPQPAYQQAPYQPPAGQAAPNQTPLNPATSNPVCVRLEGQLAAFDRGTADPARAEKIQQAQDAIAKKQADIDRATAQAHKSGCAGTGFFALFSALSPQCGPITSQIQQMRGDLDRMMSDLQQLQSGSSDQADQRRALIGQLAQNSCGAQYTAAANSQGGPQGFFDALFGGGTIVNPNGDGAPCAAATAIISRSPTPPCRPTSPKISSLANANVPPPTSRFIHFAIRARAWIRRCQPVDRSTPRCRPPIAIARSWCPAARAASQAKAGKTRLRMQTIPRRWKAATSS
jgi:hypothetical protein